MQLYMYLCLYLFVFVTFVDFMFLTGSRTFSFHVLSLPLKEVQLLVHMLSMLVWMIGLPQLTNVLADCLQIHLAIL